MAIRLINYVNNQLASPSLYADTYANIPAYGQIGRLFVSYDTKQIYRDEGNAWNLISDAGSGSGNLQTVTGNGNTTTFGIFITGNDLNLTNSSSKIYVKGLTLGSILFSSDSSGQIGQDNATFFWDNTNKRLGIGTNTPSAKLDVHSTGINATFNGTSTNNAFLVYQSAGTSKWYSGNLVSGAVANDYVIYDAVNSQYRFYVHNTGVINMPNSVIIGSTTPTSSYGFDVYTSAYFRSNIYNLNYTAGSVLFATTSGLISQDNATFFWDTTNKRLGIGNAAPTVALDVTGSGRFTSTLLVSGAATFSSSVTAVNLIANLPLGGVVGSFGSSAATNTYIKYVYNNADYAYIGNGPSIFSGAGTTDLGISTAVSSSLIFGTNNIERMRIRYDGLLFISSLISTFTTLNVANMWVNPLDGSVSRSTASSRRFKDNIKDWDGNGLNTILALKPKTFTYKADYYKNPELEMLGLIAEEVAEVSPFLAEFENEDRTGQVENVRYANIVVPLIKAIQELYEKLVRNNIN